MKTSNKIIIVFILFVLGSVVFEKYQINKKYENYLVTGDKELYDHQKEIFFKHLKINGGNISFVSIIKSDTINKIKFKEETNEKFDYKVENDTLFIEFKDKFAQQDFLSESDLHKIKVYQSNIESVDVSKGVVYMNYAGANQLKINANNTCDINAFLRNIDELNVHVGAYSKFNITTKPKKAPKLLNLTVSKNGIADLTRVQFDSIHVTKLDEGRILRRYDN